MSAFESYLQSPFQPHLPAVQGHTQAAPTRDMSPSPPFRDTRRPIKNQSIPLVPSVLQIFPNQSQAPTAGQNQVQQPSPTVPMTSSRRSPPPSAQQPPPQNLPTPPHQPNTTPQVTPPPHNQPTSAVHNSQIGYPRPIPRVPPPQFLQSYHGPDEKWHITPELLAEIERADLAQSQLLGSPGTSGVAYAGGAGGYTAHIEPESPPKDPVIDRVRANDRSSPKEADHRRQSSSSNRKPNSPNTPERRESPTVRTSHGSATGEHGSANFMFYPRDSRQPPHQRASTPPHPRRTSHATDTLPSVTAPVSNKQSPPQQKDRPTPDRSLPVQEEAEDDHVVSNHTASSPSQDAQSDPRSQRQDSSRGGRESRTGYRTGSSETIFGLESEEHSGREEEEGYTPRSTVVDLQGHTPAQNGTTRQPSLRAKARSGPTDQLGMRSIDPAMFEQPPRHREFNQAPRYLPQIQQQQQHPTQYLDGYVSEQNTNYGPYPDDVENYLIQSYVRSPRPNAPIPPTPHSQTAAPSPSPLISNSDSSLGDPPFPMGSPHPYPYSHVRRTHMYPSATNHAQPYDPNHPSAIQEQLALQWQIYARNNHGHMTDSTLSPSVSPFQGPGYNPWAFLHTARPLGSRRVAEHNSMSLRSSPSHEPVALPPRVRGSVKRKDRQTALRSQVAHTKVQPPPRVESTQPRETSPEPSSSGEETAGEERQPAAQDGGWSNEVPVLDDSADWIDEDAEPDDDDLLELEYHPTFVCNVEKRRRRWETRWEALVQAFHALDRQTDATLILMASPSHTTKLHMLSSRSIRRDPDQHDSQEMTAIRSSFRRIATRRRVARPRKPSLAERLLLHNSGSSIDGSEVSTESREEELKRALETALGSLSVLSKIYDAREVRWREEMQRLSDDREHVEMLLRQTVGSNSTVDSVGRAL